jgi:hypothetical protein
LATGGFKLSQTGGPGQVSRPALSLAGLFLEGRVHRVPLPAVAIGETVTARGFILALAAGLKIGTYSSPPLLELRDSAVSVHSTAGVGRAYRSAAIGSIAPR